MLKITPPRFLVLVSGIVLLSTVFIQPAAAKDGEDDDSGSSSSASAPSPSPEGIIEFHGILVSIKGEVWTVAGRGVIVNAGTRRRGNLQTGTFVKVAVRAQTDGSFLAREIGLADVGPGVSPAPGAGEDLEFRGVVDFAGDGIWVIAGWVVVKDANTELKAGLRVNLRVKVEGRMQNDGSVLAREIELDD